VCMYMYLLPCSVGLAAQTHSRSRALLKKGWGVGGELKLLQGDVV